MNERILIADSHPEWLAFAQRTLEEHGYRIVAVNNVTALETLAESDGYDLILVNAELLFGDFREPVHRLFLQNKDRPIIVVSVPASVHQAIQETRTAFKFGANDYLDKPFSGARLLSLVRTLLVEFVRPPLTGQGANS